MRGEQELQDPAAGSLCPFWLLLHMESEGWWGGAGAHLLCPPTLGFGHLWHLPQPWQGTCIPQTRDVFPGR